jgi:hypothetical protein
VLGVGWQAAISGAIAGSVGLTELISRYRSSPGFSLKQLAAIGYVAINIGAGVLALYLVRAFGWNFGQTQNVTLWRILVAGFGALALFRSSLFVTRIGSSDVNVGPSVVLGALLDACDRTVDRASAKNLSGKISDEKVAGLNPAAVGAALPVICLALMQNFAPSDQALLAADLNKVKQDVSLTPDVQMRAVIVQLAKYLGPGVVDDVLDKAKSLFTQPPVPAPAADVLPIPTAAEAAAVLGQAKALTHDAQTEEAPSAEPPEPHE